ncbi:T9SS type A sorting domain-containing protein [candidate division KSB1 bacterium]|nr:T9SS type A sorting domain-containing protein [candidate division KSB1 bacterium]
MLHKFKVLIYLSLFLLVTSVGYSQTSVYDTIQVDFGSNITEGVWNNFNDAAGAGELAILKNSRNLYTGIGINVYSRFNGINTGGTTAPDANVGYPSTATSDSYYGNTAEWQGLIIPTAGLLVSGLNPEKHYTFEIFASRVATDNRETQYKFTGATMDSVLLNPSGNTANTVSVTMQPKDDGSIDLNVSPGPNNNNSYGFFYLGAIKLIYEQEDVLPPAITLTAPNGGEELTGGTNYNITWDAINLVDDVVISYSTNNGTSWDEIATVQNSQTSISWLVPNTSSNNCMVQVVSGAASDQSDSLFTILPAISTKYDTIQVDFGSNLTEGVWNNFNDAAGAGEITTLRNSRNLYTGMGLNIYDRFNGINTGGTTTPDANAGYPSTASSDSYYGNTAEWQGLIEPTGAMVISGLNPEKQYTFEIFASRLATDNRETQYKFTGATMDSVLLNPSNNTATTVSITLQPKEDRTIDLTVSPGPNNNNSSGFYYLGALKMIYEQEEVLPPAITLTAPNGGEELTGGTNYNITWDAVNLVQDVVISYSTNNGSSWNEIATVDSAQTSYSWLVSNTSSSNCLVQVVSGTASDQSDSEFTILPSISTVYDTIQVDFGSNLSAGAWNNFNDGSGAGEITTLRNSKNLYTGMGINVYDRFNGINTGGTTTPDANVGYPSSATSDSYFGNITEFSGLIEPTGAMLISGLNPEKQYTFEVFASRVATDNRETQYKFSGATMDSVLLNPSNNTATTVSVTVQPKEDGTIDLTVSPGPNNNNGSGFYYLGALKMIYEQEAVLPPAISLTAPNGGEELTAGANYFITWDPVNLVADVVISYSTNNGSSWNEIATIDSSQTSFAWQVPNTSSGTCLVQVVSGTASDQSDSVFTILPLTSTVYDTILVDFGSNESAGGWNNFTDPAGTGEIPALVNSQNLYTGIGCNIFDRFNGINLNGTTSPDPNLSIPSSASNDSYYGNTALWGGLVEPSAGILFTGLKVEKSYTFEIFASRMGVSDNRETKYKFIGSVTDSLYLNAANNTTNIVAITLEPATDGTISLLLSAGENNTNSYSFYYLTAMKIIYEQEEAAPTITVLTPNGGEEWTKETEQKITWASHEVSSVKIEFSADNGITWDSLSTATASVGTFDWTLPDLNTDSALVKISSIENPEIWDVSNNVFKIDDPLTGEYRKLIVVLGSSTAAGTGASNPDSSWVGRYRHYVQSLDPKAYVVNLAVGGFTSYDVMPSDYESPAGKPTPKPENNITKALTYKPSAIIVNLPSNDAASGFGIGEQIYNLNTILEIAKTAEIPIWLTTTQPRNLSQTLRENLMQMRDYILSLYKDNAISIFDSLANEDGTIRTIYNSGDGVHVNDAGHKVIFDQVVETKIWETIVTDVSTEEIQVPTSFELNGNYPNPFNPSTTITFSLPVSSDIDVRIYDIAGREVTTLVVGKYSAGTYNLVWDASQLASGMYIYRITAHGSDNTHFSKSMKMMFIK